MKQHSHALAAFLASAILAVLPLSSISADAPATPSTLSGGKVITVEEGKKLLDSKAATFIDTRAVLNFGKGHVPSALIAAYKENSDKVESFDASKDQFDLSKLPSDKSKAIVFYSDGPTGWKSYKAAVLAIKAGYKNVHYMRGGYAEWTAKSFATEN